MSKNPDKSHGNDATGSQPSPRCRDDLGFDGQRIVEMRIDSRPDCLRLVRAVVSEAASASGFSEDCVREVVLAVDEACQNIIRHAYGGEPDGEILLDMRHEGDRLAVYLVDFADPVDEATVKPRPLDQVKPGGLGTHFIQQCMDESGFRTPPKGAGNCLRMVKWIK